MKLRLIQGINKRVLCRHKRLNSGAHIGQGKRASALRACDGAHIGQGKRGVHLGVAYTLVWRTPWCGVHLGVPARHRSGGEKSSWTERGAVQARLWRANSAISA